MIFLSFILADHFQGIKKGVTEFVFEIQVFKGNIWGVFRCLSCCYGDIFPKLLSASCWAIIIGVLYSAIIMWNSVIQLVLLMRQSLQTVEIGLNHLKKDNGAGIGLFSFDLLLARFAAELIACPLLASCAFRLYMYVWKLFFLILFPRKAIFCILCIKLYAIRVCMD